MGFFSKKKSVKKVAAKPVKKAAPVVKAAPKPAPAPKKTVIEEVLHDRVLTAEGWRRRVNAKAKKAAR
jgi:hypothetical protein